MYVCMYVESYFIVVKIPQNNMRVMRRDGWMVEKKKKKQGKKEK